MRATDFHHGRFVLGDYLDALNKAKQVKQRRIEADRLETEVAQQTAQQKTSDAIDAANKWKKHVLGPVVI